MKQDLEKYLKTNRLKLDLEKPDEDLIWQGIKGGMDKKNQTLPSWFWKVAALFFFAVSVSYFVVNENRKEPAVVFTVADFSDESGKQETDLKYLVNLKWEEVKPLLNEENSEIQFLLNQMNELDEVYKTYQNDLGVSDANEEIIRALLDYYQKKMRILNRILHEIQKQNNHEKTITL